MGNFAYSALLMIRELLFICIKTFCIATIQRLQLHYAMLVFWGLFHPQILWKFSYFILCNYSCPYKI